MRQFRSSVWWAVAIVLAVVGCHKEKPEDLPPAPRKIGLSDKFYDVVARGEKSAIVVGYGGKILMTEDGGRTWDQRPSGTDQALYSVDFIDANKGWISGQDGLILRTTDGGKTWTPQNSGTTLYLFDLDFVNEREGWVVGDRATYLHTTNGGETWALAKIKSTESHLSADEALLAQEPVLYDVQFFDEQHGWIVGEFGNIFYTSDAGRTWTSQQETLLGDGIFDAMDLPTFFGVHFVDGTNGLAAGLDGRIARTQNAGAKWTFEKFDLKRPIIDPLYNPFQFPDTTAWAVGAAGEVVRQNAPGAPWVRQSLGMEIVTWLRGIDFLDTNNGWIVGGYGLILRTTDGGQTWLPSIG